MTRSPSAAAGRTLGELLNYNDPTDIPRHKRAALHWMSALGIRAEAEHSTSKSICSGLRVAYLVYGGDFKGPIEKAIFNINVKTSSLDAEIITELILSGKAGEIVEVKRRLAQTANGLFASYFPQAPRPGHPLSFYRWLPLSSQATAVQIESSFQSEGIRVYHSDRFLSGARTADSYLRVSLASTPSLMELEAGLDILKRHFPSVP